MANLVQHRSCLRNSISRATWAVSSVRRLAVVLAILGAVLVQAAFAGSITIFNTGENNGVALPVGKLDPHYSLISAPVGVPLTAITTLPAPVWVPNTSTADWISPGNSAYIYWPIGTYDYRTTFSLAGFDPATARLSGMWTSDNNACIYLNGVNTQNCTPYEGFRALIPFSISSGFVSGTNTLDLMVYNGGLSTGAIMEVSGTANQTTPEPSTLVLLASGILGAFRAVRPRMLSRH